MLCMQCGANAEKGYTTDVTEVENGIVIIRKVPCYKCQECNEIIYTADVVARLEKMVEAAQHLMQEISVIDYSKVA
ncbi:MAG: YgiT-type zinc finger protein [Clostridiales bacterium]|nr:YgiT-type zinc finger protein [Clostridiales bacterium]